MNAHFDFSLGNPFSDATLGKYSFAYELKSYFWIFVHDFEFLHAFEEIILRL